MKNFLKDLGFVVNESTLMGVAIVIVIAFLILGGLMFQRAFIEPRRQDAYEFKVSQLVADWCSSNEDDPFADGTRATLRAAVDGEPDRFDRVPSGVRMQIDAVIRGDRASACGQ